MNCGFSTFCNGKEEESLPKLLLGNPLETITGRTSLVGKDVEVAGEAWPKGEEAGMAPEEIGGLLGLSDGKIRAVCGAPRISLNVEEWEVYVVACAVKCLDSSI